jgi:hypothetical protein
VHGGAQRHATSTPAAARAGFEQHSKHVSSGIGVIGRRVALDGRLSAKDYAFVAEE